jgi:hypothetical protein
MGDRQVAALGSDSRERRPAAKGCARASEDVGERFTAFRFNRAPVATMLEEHTKGLGEQERNCICHDNAAELYRIAV